MDNDKIIIGSRNLGKAAARKLMIGCDLGAGDVTAVSAFEKTEDGLKFLGSKILEKIITEDADFEVIEPKQISS